MKKLLVSDFDRTLYVDGKIPAENVEALVHWQEAGNLFAIATGRAEGILRMLLEEYAVTPNVLICNNGSNIVAWDGTRIEKRYIEQQTVFPLVDALLYQYRTTVDVTLDASRIQVEHGNSTAALSFVPADVSETMTLESFQAENRQALQIHLRFPTAAQTQSAAKAIEQQFPAISAYPNVCNLDIVANGSSKAQGIEALLNWSRFDGKVITIGDSYNDLEMLRLYEGYTLDSANPEIQCQAAHICTGVAACVQAELISCK